MKKIIYYMQVDWGWIEQRPHILARGLAENAEVHVIFAWEYRRKNLQNNVQGKVHLHPLYLLPRRGFRYPVINSLNHMISRVYLHRLIKRISPDILWLTHPFQFLEIPRDYDGSVVYDCMDDHELLWPQKSQCDTLAQAERSLCKRASVIFATSSVLKKKMQQYIPEKEIQLVRNGCDGKLYLRLPAENLNRLKIGYVGTISHWFDFDLLLKSLQEISGLEYELIGPVSMSELPQHPRLHYRGAMQHDKLFEAVRDLNALVMPFKKMQGIDAVDPVKLYEYIGWQKPILAVRYPEIERFAPFAVLYKNDQEYIAGLQNLRQNSLPCYSEQEAKEFLQENSWDARIQHIQKALEELGNT